MTPGISVALPALLFLTGVLLLVFCVERLVESLAKAAVAAGISAFFLAVVFTGLDFENWAFGIASALGDLPGIAIGSAFGSALFLAGVAVPAAGFLVPFEVRVPRDYLVLTAAAPLILAPFLLDGAVSRPEGGALCLILGGALAYLYRREKRGEALLRDAEVEEAEEEVLSGDRPAWYYLGISALLVLGMIVGSELAVRGARGVVAGFGLDETAFGMTFVGLVMSLEEVLLVVEPVRRGRVPIAAGNLVGSLLFFSTGNVGLIAATRRLPLDPGVLHLYWPFLFGSTALVTLFLWRGRVKRPEAVLLGLVYLAYWALAYA
ncbi:MAG: sodium:calcium antiporter [Gemmatimonadota bacterium]